MKVRQIRQQGQEGHLLLYWWREQWHGSDQPRCGGHHVQGWEELQVIILSLRTPEDYEKEEKSNNKSVCKITLYENGFTIDDGEFQDYNDPKNKDFMKKLNDGYIPPELRKKYPKGELSVSLSDKTSEKFVPPPPPAYV